MQKGSGTQVPYIFGKSAAACGSASSDYNGKLCAAADTPTRCKDTITTMTFNGVPYKDCSSLIDGYSKFGSYCDNDSNKICQLTCKACSIPSNVGAAFCGVDTKATTAEATTAEPTTAEATTTAVATTAEATTTTTTAAAATAEATTTTKGLPSDHDHSGHDHATTTMATTTTTEGTVSYNGKIKMNITGANKQQVETAIKAALAVKLNVTQDSITNVVATQSRRLSASKRRLAGTWDISYTVTQPAAQEAALNAKVLEMKNDKAGLKTTMVAQLKVAGAANPTVEVGEMTDSSVVTHEEEPPASKACSVHSQLLIAVAFLAKVFAMP